MNNYFAHLVGHRLKMSDYLGAVPPTQLADTLTHRTRMSRQNSPVIVALALCVVAQLVA